MSAKPAKIKLRKRRLPIGGGLLVVAAMAFIGTQLLASFAATGYYSCKSGDKLSTTTCTDTSTYAATYHAGYYYCDGGDTLSGSTCSHSSSYTAGYVMGCNTGDTQSGSYCRHYTTPTTTYHCNSGDTLSGRTCYHYYTGGGLSGRSCNSGDTWTGTKCQHTYAASATYKCPFGYTSSGSTCYFQYSQTKNYYCSSGDRLSGTSCIHTTSYSAHFKAGYYSCNSGDTLSGQTCAHTTKYAATYHSSSGTTVVGKGSVSTTTSTSKAGGSSGSKVIAAPARPPSAPGNFAATVTSSKIVELSWSAGQASAGVQNYEAERSTDSKNWVLVASPTETAYTDTTADFATHYFYRVREIDASGAASKYATADVTTGKFVSSQGTIVSDDKLVTVEVPDGAFDQAVNCSVTSSDGGLPSVPTKSLLLGPYQVLCVAEDGSTVTSFAQPLQVTMDLSGASSGYGSFAARLFDDSGSANDEDGQAAFDKSAQTLKFQLASSKSFAAYGTAQKSVWATVFQIFLFLVLLVGGVFGVLYLRRYWSGRTPAPLAAGAADTMGMMPTAATSSPSAEAVFEQAALKPSCTHLTMAHQVQPQTAGCAECTAEGKHWKALRICLTCGHVGCSDDSSEQHARKHFETTGHPLIYEYANPAGDSIGWCYIDQTYI